MSESFLSGRSALVTGSTSGIGLAIAQVFGGAGTSREYPIEKLFRDARSALIEDGENYVLTMRLGVLAQQLYADGWTRS